MLCRGGYVYLLEYVVICVGCDLLKQTFSLVCHGVECKLFETKVLKRKGIRLLMSSVVKGSHRVLSRGGVLRLG